MLFSLKDVSSKLSPTPGIDGLHTVKTNTFTLHHFESLTGMMFVLNTAPEIQGTFVFYVPPLRNLSDVNLKGDEILIITIALNSMQTCIKRCNTYIRICSLITW